MDLLYGSREEGFCMECIFPKIDLRETGKRIKELREQRGISVKQLQCFLGFEQPQAIYKWQRGECLPTFDNMYAIACLFHVTIDEILVGNRQEFFYFRGKLFELFCKIKNLMRSCYFGVKCAVSEEKSVSYRTKNLGVFVQ